MNLFKDTTTVGELMERLQGIDLDTPLEELYPREEEKVKLICQEVHFFTEVSIDQMKKKTRKRAIVDARKLLYYLLRRFTSLSLSKIASMTGQHHTTVVHGIKEVKSRMEVDSSFAKDLASLHRRINIFSFN